MTGYSYSIIVLLQGPIEPFGKREVVEDLLDGVMEQLLDSDLIDPRVSESYLPDGEVKIEFALDVESTSPEQAVTQAMGAIRSSFHALGTGTPGWEHLIEEMRSDIRATSADSGDLVNTR